MNRHALKDAQWARLKPFMPDETRGRPSKLGVRNFMDAIVWKLKTGVSWRDLHDQFGPWKTIYNRFRNWAERGVWEKMFDELATNKTEFYSILDGSVVRAHQDASGGKGGPKKTRLAGRAAASRRKSTRS